LNLRFAGSAATAVAIVAACLAFASPAEAGGGLGGGYEGYGPYTREAVVYFRCAHTRRQRACLIKQTLRLLRSHGPAHELPRIDRYVLDTTGGYFLNHCHGLMHTIGRRYGQMVHVTLARLRQYLPRSNNPGCSAGFAHGLLTYLGPQIIKIGPKGAAAQCATALTRYQRYSCIHGLGHAYMRLFGELFGYALRWCRALGPGNAVDCAQGVYHDYWISLSGMDNTHRPAHAKTSPRALCGSQPRMFVRGCWYRAFIEHPPPRKLHSAGDLLAVCRKVHGLQREACVTAASVIASDDPFHQLRICAKLDGRLAVDCAHGVQVWNTAGARMWYQVSLVRLCASFDRRSRTGCYSWLGKTLNVVLNGRFGPHGCPRLHRQAARAACARGARSYESPLVTFS
jgi:hypothetical protein